MVCLHWSRPWPRLIPKPTVLGLMIKLGSGYSGPRPRLMQISIGSVCILSVLVSVSGSVNEPLDVVNVVSLV